MVLKKAMKRWLAGCLTLALLLAGCPGYAFAADPAQTDSAQSEGVAAPEEHESTSEFAEPVEEESVPEPEPSAEVEPTPEPEPPAEEEPMQEPAAQVEHAQTFTISKISGIHYNSKTGFIEFENREFKVNGQTAPRFVPIIPEMLGNEGTVFLTPYRPSEGIMFSGTPKYYSLSNKTSPNYNLSNSYKLYFEGTLPEGRTISRVYTGEGVEFCTETGAKLDIRDDGSFTFYLSHQDSDANVKCFSQRDFAGCFYFELDDGTIYPLIMNYGVFASSGSTDTATGEPIQPLPTFVSLRSAKSQQWLGADFEVTGLEKLEQNQYTSTVVHADLEADSPWVQVQVKSSGYDRHPYREPETRECWVVVNGVRQPSFVNTHTLTQGAGNFSAPFALKPGLNVVEICTKKFGAYSSESYQSYGGTAWFYPAGSSAYFDDATAGIVYLIDYKGPAATGTYPTNSDTSIDLLKAVTQGSTKENMNRLEASIVWDGANEQYLLNLPEYFRPTTDSSTIEKESFDKALFITAIAGDSQSTVEVVNETNNGGNFIINRVGAMTAVGLDYLSADSRFELRVTASDGTVKIYPVQITYASGEAGLTSATIDGASFDVSFEPETYDYYINFSGASAQATLTLAQGTGMSLAVDGEPYAGPVTVSASQPYYKVTVTAADTITTTDYFFVPRYGSEGNWTVPFRTISGETRAQAQNMLGQYAENLANVKEFGSYWNIFFARATETPEKPFDFDGLNVYDVRKHTTKQATDWAACIMEIIMLGGNPYDFPRYVDGVLEEHFDYVAALQKQGGGPFANNVWYAYAANAAGVENIFFESNKKNALYKYYDLDTRAWSIASLSAILDTKEMVRYIDGLHDSQSVKAGEASDIGLFRNNVVPLGYNNLYTNGCVLSAIASAGADVNRLFALNGTNPLTLLIKHGEKTGENLLVKDMVIGLGDILYGSNVWARYALTEEKYNALLDKAAENGVPTEGMPAYGETDYGKKYFELYSQVGAALAAKGDYSMTPRVTYGLSYQIFEDAVKALPDTVTDADLTAVKAAIDQYEALTTDMKGYVSTEVMNKYHAVVSAALALQDDTNAASDVYSSILALPAPLVIPADKKAEVEAIRAAYEALSAEQQALIAWSGASTLAKLEACETVFKPTEPENPDNPDTPSTPTGMTITFKLLGAPNDGENGTVHMLKAGNLETWYTTTQTFNTSSVSAEQAFRLIMDNANIEWRGDTNNEFGSIYIRGIKSPLTGEWMEEFTTSNTSGWMYTVNGKHPNVGMTNTTLYSGDAFVVHYTDDYTQEQEASEWSSSGGGSGTPDKKPDSSTPAVTTTVKDGTSTTVVEDGALDEMLKNAGADAPVVIAAELPKGETVTKSEVALTRGDMGAVAKTGAPLRAETPLATVVLSGAALQNVAGTASQKDEKVTITASVTENGTRIELAAAGKILDEVDGGLLVTLPVAGDALTAGSVMVVVGADGTETVLKKSVRSGNGVTALLDGSGTVKVIDNTRRFDDVASTDWYDSAVAFAVSHELFTGTGETTFDPTGLMTRGMLVTVLHRLEDAPSAWISNAFGDVTGDAWYTGAVYWASENGIVTGYSENVFAPNDSITREQMAVMLYRYARYMGLDESASARLDSYADRAEISDWANEAMQWAVGAGLMQGKSAIQLDPAGTTTRAEVATVLQRLISLMAV